MNGTNRNRNAMPTTRSISSRHALIHSCTHALCALRSCAYVLMRSSSAMVDVHDDDVRDESCIMGSRLFAVYVHIASIGTSSFICWIKVYLFGGMVNENNSEERTNKNERNTDCKFNAVQKNVTLKQHLCCSVKSATTLHHIRKKRASYLLRYMKCSFKTHRHTHKDGGHKPFIS